MGIFREEKTKTLSYIFTKLYMGKYQLFCLTCYLVMQKREQIIIYVMLTTLTPSRIDILYKSFIPHAIRLWNNLQPDLRNMHEYKHFKTHLNKDRPSRYMFYSLGSRKAGIHHAHIRMKCSALNHDLYSNHITDSSECICGHNVEDATHYFFVCPNYNMQRAILHDEIIPHAPFNLHTILHGVENLPQPVNELLANAVHNYIESTSRFY